MIGNKMIETFQKLEGFDFKWTSLITNNPLLFEDLNYFKVKRFIDETVTEKEIQAYKDKNLRELYPTFDSLLVCNLKYYDRIINYCTMVFLKYVEINGYSYNTGLKRLPYELSLTPTKIWCAVLSSENSTLWELEYGWDIKKLKEPISISDKSVLEVNYKKIYNENKSFAKFNEYNSIRLKANGYRNCLLLENTPNKKLANVCQKFTKTSTAISESQLNTLSKYINHYESINKKLYKSLYTCLIEMFKGDDNQFSIFIFSDEFFILSSKFSLKVSKKNNKIQKDYLANSYECFLAEKYLVKSIDAQIEWSKIDNVSENSFSYEKQLLISILTNLIEKDYKDVILINQNRFEKNSLVKVTFSGIFSMVKINEEFIIDNRCIKRTSKVLSKQNAAKYLIERGYYIFGNLEDIDNLLSIKINKDNLINHYSKYCIPVLNYMFDIVTLYQLNNKDIIDVLINDNINPEKLNNHNIIYTSLTNQTELDLNKINNNNLNEIKKSLNNIKKSYWRIIEE